MFLTYTEYQAYGGTLDEATFNQFEFEAEAMINYRTFNRLKNETTYGTAIKRCTFVLISVAQNKQAAASAGGMGGQTTAAVSSESNDGFSKSYNVMDASKVYDIATQQAEGIIDKYLNGVLNELGQDVLYRGIYPNE